MNYAKINRLDCANAIGLSTSIFVTGCPLHCPGCFNSAAWDKDVGEKVTEKTYDLIVDYMIKDEVVNFSVLGGEPLAPYNVEETIKMIYEVTKRYHKKASKDFNVMIYTGYDIETAVKMIRGKNPLNSLAMLSVPSHVLIKAGPYDEDKKDISLPLRGSSNQHIYNFSINRESSHAFDVTEEVDELMKHPSKSILFSD